MSNEKKLWTRKDVENVEQDQATTVFIVNNIVYDVKAFLDEHPGGHEVLIDVQGKDASQSFHDIGHSSDAYELMKKYKIGEVVESERIEFKKSDPGSPVLKDENKPNFLLPLILGVIATIIYYYLFNGSDS